MTINIKREKIESSKFAVDKLFHESSNRLKRDMDAGRSPTQFEEQYVESLSTASAVLGIVLKEITE